MSSSSMKVTLASSSSLMVDGAAIRRSLPPAAPAGRLTPSPPPLPLLPVKTAATAVPSRGGAAAVNSAIAFASAAFPMASWDLQKKGVKTIGDARARAAVEEERWEDEE